MISVDGFRLDSGILQKHIPQLVAIDRQSYLTPLDASGFVGHLRQSRHHGTMAVDRGDVLGFVLYHTTPSEIRIDRLAVRSDYRRSGVGHELIEHLKTLVVVQNRTWLRCVAELDADLALAFLLSQDFLSTRLITDCPGDAVEMSWASDPMDCEFAGSVSAAEYVIKRESVPW